MNFNFFTNTQVPFISVNKHGFSINNHNNLKVISCFIKEITPVRKFFHEKTLKCFSNNAIEGKNGKVCAICENRKLCKKRLRLLLEIINDDKNKPAIIEVNQASFKNIKNLIKPIPENELQNIPVQIGFELHNNFIILTFSVIK